MRNRGIGAPGVAVVCLLAGCSILAPQADPSRYYVLTPVAAASAGGGARPLALGFGPVTLPGYLVRPEVVRRDGESKLVLSKIYFWGEPLERNVRSVVAENLRRLLGPVEIVQYPWFATVAIDYEIPIDVLRFEADEHGTVSLDARWAIRRRGTKPLARSSESHITQPAADASTESVVAAMSEALGALSREIAAGLR
jgi:uncharacterized lipoprotein YmbA